MLRPEFQRHPLLVGKVVLLVDAGNAAERSTDMVEKSFDRWQRHAELGHSGRRGSPYVVHYKPPDRLATVELRNRRIERCLGFAVAADRTRASRREIEVGILQAGKTGENTPRP